MVAALAAVAHVAAGRNLFSNDVTNDWWLVVGVDDHANAHVHKTNCYSYSGSSSYRWAGQRLGHSINAGVKTLSCYFCC